MEPASPLSHADWMNRYEATALQVSNFIDGRWCEVGDANGRIDKFGPRDGRKLASFGSGTASDAERAVSSAKDAFEDGRWAALSAQRRKDVLYRLAALIEENAEELALLESLDVGKPIHDALTFDVPVSAAIIRANAEALDKVHGLVYAVDQSSLSYELRRPIGVVAGIVGWNFPLVLAAGKIGPVLAMGNSLVLKPSELTSFSAKRIAELAVKAGVPEGVLNVIHGDGRLGAALATHLAVNLITFTGSTATGKQLLIAAGQSNMKRLVLECGGKAPNIVFEDSPDLDAVADAVAVRAFWNQGQVCTASCRLVVQESIKDELVRRIVDKVAKLAPADPLNPSASFGAVVSEAHRQKVLAYVADGEQSGARKLYQSHAAAPISGGFYVPPVIFDQVSMEHRIAKEEIFGPVLSVLSFTDEHQAIAVANDTIYGLSAIVWTTNMGRAHRVSQGIQAGWVTVNATSTPKGGPGVGVLSVGGHKQSGLGAEGGIGGLKEYTSSTAVQFYV
jgi:acyl-CoA reductase-like NAD-dependent aldehyde dehydrogenase